MARERQNKRRKQSRVFLVAAVPLALLILLFAAVWAVLNSIRVENYLVEGDTRYTEEELWDASGIRMQESLLRAPLRQAEADIPKALPYIASVRIKRKLPKTVIFQVTEIERVFAAKAESGKDWLLLSDRAKVLEKTAKPPKETLRVLLPPCETAVPGKTLVFEQDVLASKIAASSQNAALSLNTSEPPSVLQTYETLLGAVGKSKLASSITEINMERLSDIRMIYKWRITLKFGGITGLEERLEFAARLIQEEEKEDPKVAGSIDLKTLKWAYFRPEPQQTPDKGKPSKSN